MDINTPLEFKNIEELAAMSRPELERRAAALLLKLTPSEREAILNEYKT